MDLRQLRYFVGIVRAGSVSRAADELNIAQSAISHHLASLESELDKQLVTRGPKGIQLTEAGTVLYRHAEAILRHVEFAKQDAMTALNVPSGRVSVGLPTAIAPLVSYELFMRVREAFPQILLHVADSNGALLRERLLNDRLDIALLFTHQAERGLAVEPLLMEELFYVTADPDPSPITLADAARRPLLVSGPSSSSRRIVQQVFNEHGLSATWIGEIDTSSALRRAVAAGIGNAILTWCNTYDGERKAALNCRRFADVALVRPVGLCFSQVGQRNPAIETVAATLKSLVRELIEGGIWQGVSMIVRPAEPSRLPAPPSEFRIGRRMADA
ncbi:MAG: LysR substrate-binding domain-containing protein [Xanthobacteraceae bacterium]|jgi:LysR family nitrogen assimilation transcriptional regulator